MRAAGRLKELMAGYYLEADQVKADPNRKLAWVTAVFPVELLYAMDVFPYYPENYGAKMASRKMAEAVSRVAEGEGYPSDLCSYALVGLGSTLRMKGAAQGQAGTDEITLPDLLVACNTQCTTLSKWFETTAVYRQAPLFVLDSPFLADEDSFSEDKLTYFLNQLKELVLFLESQTGHKLDLDRLGEVLAHSQQACRLWNEILALGRTKPAAFTFFDACIHMAPIVTRRGTPEAVEYYQALKAELEERADQGVYPVERETARLYWSGIPFWHRLRYFSDFFSSRGASVVTSLYSLAWGYDFDLKRPMETLAENYLGVIINRGLKQRTRQVINLIDQYALNGLVLFSNRSCKSDSFGLYSLKDLVYQARGVPSVVIEGDMCDDRFFSQAQVETRLEAFLEQIGN